jgi:hypothetical protein
MSLLTYVVNKMFSDKDFPALITQNFPIKENLWLQLPLDVWKIIMNMVLKETNISEQSPIAYIKSFWGLDCCVSTLYDWSPKCHKHFIYLRPYTKQSGIFALRSACKFFFNLSKRLRIKCCVNTKIKMMPFFLGKTHLQNAKSLRSTDNWYDTTRSGQSKHNMSSYFKTRNTTVLYPNKQYAKNKQVVRLEKILPSLKPERKHVESFKNCISFSIHKTRLEKKKSYRKDQSQKIINTKNRDKNKSGKRDYRRSGAMLTSQDCMEHIRNRSCKACMHDL